MSLLLYTIGCTLVTLTSLAGIIGLAHDGTLFHPHE